MHLALKIGRKDGCKTMKILARLLLVFICLSAALVHADHYIIGVEQNDYLPYWQGSNSEYSGFGRELLDAFAEYSGHSFTYKPYPIKRALNSLLSGDVDAKFPDNPNWSVSKKKGHAIVYSNPVQSFTDGVLVVPEKYGSGITGLKRLGTIRGFTPFAYLDRIKNGDITLNESNELIQAIKMALADRTDGVYFNPQVARHIFRNNGLARDTLIFDPTLPHANGSYHFSSIKHPALVQDLNRFMVDQANQIIKLKSRHGLD